MTIYLAYVPNADVLHIFKEGHSYELKVSSNSDFGGIDTNDTDDRRFILYALMHHFARLYPQEKIKLAVVDNNLNRVNRHYNKNPLGMPANVTLEQHVALGYGPRQVKVTKGTGEIDTEYSLTIQRDLADLQGQRLKDDEENGYRYSIGGTGKIATRCSDPRAS